MANTPPSKETAQAPKPEETVTLTVADLLLMMNQNAEKNAKALADAILESRKPYVDPKQTAVDDQIRDATRRQKQQMDEQIRREQETCPHFQGSSQHSQFQGQQSSIVRHRLDSGVIFGICTNCQRQFWPADPDYKKEILGRKHGNALSESGTRFRA